jgi:hypothetical protein
MIKNNRGILFAMASQIDNKVFVVFKTIKKRIEIVSNEFH